MKLTGTPGKIMDALAKIESDAWTIPSRAQQNTLWSKRQIWFYQAAALGILAKRFNTQGAHILEIGTALGYSATILAQNARLASIHTLNPKDGEYELALPYLSGSRNIVPLKIGSQDYLLDYGGLDLDMVFIDGDHRYESVKADCRWYDWLVVGGLMLFHDYSPEGSVRACPDTYKAVNSFRDILGRDFDVLVVDDRKVGMAGFYKQDGE